MTGTDRRAARNKIEPPFDGSPLFSQLPLSNGLRLASINPQRLLNSGKRRVAEYSYRMFSGHPNSGYNFLPVALACWAPVQILWMNAFSAVGSCPRPQSCNGIRSAKMSTNNSLEWGCSGD